jgi:glycosyltransferase involved in cell wall biosynthesis
MVNKTITRPKPNILFVGPILGSNVGFTPSPVEALIPLLKEKGYVCMTTSKKTDRLKRLFDMLSCIIKTRKWSEIICLQVYAYRSFVVEDIASWVAKRFNKKIIMVLHYGDFPNFLRIFPKWSKRVLQRADQIITPSQYLQKAVQGFGFSVKVIPNLILIQKYPFRQRDFVRPSIIWMRSFFRYYNPTLALDAFKLIKEQYPDAELTMAGSNKGLEKMTKEYAYKIGLIDSVKFPGFLSMNSKQAEFSKHDIYLNTTIIDNMPISILEAAAFGLPIVSTNVGGIPYILQDEKNALLVPSNNPDAIAKAIMRIIEKPGLAYRLSLAGRQLAESCGPDFVIPLWEEILSK